MGGFSVYGLGILLTLEDKVSDKLGGVSKSLQNLSMKAMSLNYMGKSLMNTGKALLSPIVGLSKEVIRVGDDVDKARITFGALYNDATLGAEKFNEVIKYAASTPFDVESLKDAALQFKTLGVELFGTESMVTDATGETRQLIDIIGDAGAGLSGVARNGFKDVVYATREFITEGNKLSFLRRLGIDIDAVLAKGIKADNVMKELSLSAGETVEERKVAYANLIKALNMDGLMKDMKGTWSQVMSNMGDIWYLFMMKVGDKGTFKVFKEAFKGISDTMKALLDTDVADKFCDSVSMALESVTRPLDIGIKKLMGFVEQIIRIGAERPNLIKFAFSITSLAGVLFMLAGAGLVAQGSMLILGHGLAVIVSLIPKALLLAGLFAVIKTAWTKDIGGIRTRLTGFVNTVNTSFSKAKEILALSTDDMIKSYNDLVEQYSKTGDFGAGLTAGIIRTAKIWGAFVDFWNDSTLSQENLKILNEMGLMPMFEKIATWTEKFKAFFKGVTEGFSEMANAVGDFVDSIMTKFFPTLETGNGQGLFDSITGKFNGGDMSDIQNMGKNAMKLVPTVLGLIQIAKLIRKHNRAGGTGGGLSGLLSRILGGRNPDNPDGGNGNGSGILGSLRRIGGTLASLNPMQILRGLGNLAIILVGLGVIAMVIGGMARISPSAMFGGALAIAALSLALIPISSPTFDTAINSISRMSRFKDTTFKKGLKNLAVILGSLSVMTMLIGAFVGISPAAFIAGGVAITAMGFMFTAIGNPVFISAIKQLQVLAKIDTKEILRGLAKLGLVLGSLAVLFMVIGAVSMIPFNYGRVAQMVLVIGLIGAVGAALAGLGDIVGHFSAPHTIGGFMAMSAALLAMTGLFVILGAVSLIPFDYGRIAKLSLVLGLLGAVGLALIAFSAIAGLIAFAGGGFGAAAIIAGILAIDLVLTYMADLMVSIGRMTSNLDVGRLDTVMTAILKVGAIGTALSVLSGISGVMFAPAILGLATIGIVVEGMAALAQQFAKLEAKADKIQSGLNVMSMIGNGIGKAIGSFIGGIGEGISNSLPAIGQSISTFMDSIATIKTPSEGEQGIGEFLSSLADGLLKLTANDILSIFTGGTDFAGTAEGLNQLAGAKTFFDFCAGYDGTAFSNANLFFESLANISNIPNVGGIGQMFSGTNDFSGTANGLNQLANTKPFFDFCSNLQPIAFENAKNFFKSLADISNIPNVGGIGQVFSGTNDFYGTTEGLNKLAESKTFFDFVSTLDVGAFEKTKQLFEALSKIGEAFPNTGGVAQWFSGENDISGVGTKLKQFGTDTSAFFKSVSSLKVGNLNSLWDSIKKAGEVAGTDVSGLENIGTKLSNFMTNASNFFTQSATVDTSGLSNVSTALSDFFTVINGVVITGIEGLNSSISSLVSSLSSVNSQLLIMGSGFITVGSYAITAGGMVVVSLTMMATTSVATTSIIILSFTQLGQGILASALVVTAGMMLMYMGVQSGCNLIIAAIASMCSTVRSQLSSLASSGYSYGSQLSSSIAAGISANSGAIKSAVQSAILNAMSGATINIPSVKIGHNALGTSNWAGGLTEINERGGEIVDLPRGTRIYPHDDSVTMAFDEGMRTAIDSLRGNSNDNRQYDNSVYFSAGSIVVQVANASEAEAERFAELVMKKIEMKKRRKAIATYAY